MDVAIVATDLTKRFGDLLAVDHVDFEVSRSEFFGFLGPNGAGKTTTIHMLTGVMPYRIQPFLNQIAPPFLSSI